MNFRSAVYALPAIMLSAAAGFAEPATASGASDLTAVLQTYFSDRPGVVSVQPEGETYRLTVDLNPLVELIPAEGLTASVSSLSYELTDLGDGTWRVRDDQPFSASFSVPGAMQMTMSYGRMVSDGVWDTALATYSSYTAELTDMRSTTKRFGPGGDLIGDDSASMDLTRYTMKASAGASGGTDMAMEQASTGFRQTVSIPDMSGAGLMQIVVTSDTYGGAFNATGFGAPAMLELFAWFVANPSEAAVLAGEADLKAMLLSGLPWFERLDGTFTLGGVTAETPVGPVTIELLDVAVDMAGFVEDGRLREAIGVAGVGLPAGLVPDWAADLVPSSFLVDVEVSRFDLARSAATLIQALDLAAAEPVDPALWGPLLAEFMPDGLVDITIAPGHLSGDVYEIRYEGVISAGPVSAPVGQGKVTARGLDAVQAALMAAPPGEAGDTLMPLGMAMGLARPGPDGTLEWEIDATVPGTLKINGIDLMAQ